MGGFHADRIAESFGLTDTQRALTVMAVGPVGDLDAASEELQARENAPRERRPVAESLLVDD